MEPRHRMVGASLVTERHQPAVFGSQPEVAFLPAVRQEGRPLRGRCLAKFRSGEVRDPLSYELVWRISEDLGDTGGHPDVHLFVVGDEHELARPKRQRRVLVVRPRAHHSNGCGSYLPRGAWELPAALSGSPGREQIRDRSGPYGRTLCELTGLGGQSIASTSGVVPIDPLVASQVGPEEEGARS